MTVLNEEESYIIIDFFYVHITFLIKLTRGVCRGLPYYAASPERL